MLLPIILICVGLVLFVITRHGWSLEPFNAPATRGETLVVRLVSIIGIASLIYGIIRLF
jgi:hypothetical protein